MPATRATNPAATKTARPLATTKAKAMLPAAPIHENRGS
jgi:hypothetical protein